MKTYLDIYDIKTLRNMLSMVKIPKTIIFVFIFSFCFKILAINVIESLGLCP